MTEHVELPATRVPVVAECDVLVAGGGPSGVCAAVAAAREGADVVLLERAGFLGGTGTAAMVAGFMGFYWGSEVRVTGGVGHEIVERTRAMGGGDDFIAYTLGELTGNPVVSMTFPFDPEAVKHVLDDLVAEAGVRVINRAQVARALVDHGTVTGAVYHGLSQTRAVRARRTIDATGDGLVLLDAGAQIAPEGPQLQPMTLMMRVSGIDRTTLRATPKPQRREIVHQGVADGKVFYETLAMYPSPTNGDHFVLMTAVNGYHGTDELDVTAAELEGRRQIRVTMDYLRTHMPGFADAQVTQIAPWIGVRETQRIEGRYVLTEDDVRHGRGFDDAIAWGGGPMDIHRETGVILERPQAPFATPYRSLLPAGLDGCFVVGRAASATHEAMSGLRHMGAVMPLGQAAGTAAAMSVAEDRAPADVDVDALRSRLRGQGAIVDRPA